MEKGRFVEINLKYDKNIYRLNSMKLMTIVLIILIAGCSSHFEYAILSKGVRPSNSKISTLSDAEINQLEILIRNCVPQLRRNLKKYKYQYVPYVNDKGDKLVWVNVFCSKENDYWKNNPVKVLDGGDCYFNFTIDLTNQKCKSLIVNGEG